MLKKAVKIEPKKAFFEVDPKKNRQILWENRKYNSLGRKFQGFCDILNGIRAMAILLILFCM